MENLQFNNADAKYNAMDIALECIFQCQKLGRPISNLQLNKILYYVQAEFLVAQQRPCFKENILA